MRYNLLEETNIFYDLKVLRYCFAVVVIVEIVIGVLVVEVFLYIAFEVVN